MPDEQHDRADVAAPTPYCTMQLAPGTYLTLAALTAPCTDCGHATVLHIGVGHCPVCELTDLNEQARASATRVEVHVQGDVLTERKLLDAVRQGRYPR